MFLLPSSNLRGNPAAVCTLWLHPQMPCECVHVCTHVLVCVCVISQRDACMAAFPEHTHQQREEGEAKGLNEGKFWFNGGIMGKRWMKEEKNSISG